MAPQTSSSNFDWSKVSEAAPATSTGGFDWSQVDEAKPPSQQPGVLSSIVNGVIDYAKGLNKTANPFSEENRAAAAQLVSHPLDTVQNALTAQGKLGESAKESFQNGDYVNGVRHTISYLLPLIGPAIDEAGNKAGAGHLAEGLGEGTGIGLSSGMALKDIIEPNTMARIQTPPDTSAATEMYRQALKRGVKSTTPVEDVRELAKTGLQYGIPVSEEGADKLQGLISDLESKVQAEATAAGKRGVTISPSAVAERVTANLKRADQQVNPNSDVASVEAARDEFLKNNQVSGLSKFTPTTNPITGRTITGITAASPEDIPIPADQAQAMKQGTYQALGDKAYGELKGASVEAQKALARGLKEELAKAVPEIAELTPEQAKLINLDGALSNVVNKYANIQRQSFLKEAIAGGIAKSVTGSNPMGVAVGVMKHLWEDPAFKSKLATTIYRAQMNNPDKFGAPSIATATARTNALGNSLNSATSDQTPGQ